MGSKKGIVAAWIHLKSFILNMSENPIASTIVLNGVIIHVIFKNSLFDPIFVLLLSNYHY
jgi:hypothetical protein